MTKQCIYTLFRFFLFPVLLININNLYPQEISYYSNYDNLYFEQLSIEEGLSQITLHAILQDSKGFLWFGTEDGLNRYDGYKFTIYKNDLSDSGSIGDNFIWTLAEDKLGNIWIGTNSGGLNKYDYKTDRFERYTYEADNDASVSENNIRVLYTDKEGILWIGTNSSGLCKLDPSDNLISRIKSDFSGLSENINNIRYFTEDDSSNIWIATEAGLIKYDKISGTAAVLNVFNSKYGMVKVESFWSLIYNESILWIGTYNQGLLKYNVETKMVEPYTSSGQPAISDDIITDLLIDNNSKLWICTENGLSILDDRDETVINYKNDPADMNSLSSNIIRCIYQDKSDLIWIGTFGSGVNKVNLKRKFKLYTHNPTNDNSLSYNVIRSLYEDRKGNLWIGTLGNGLSIFNRSAKSFQHFSQTPGGISSNIITSILEDYQGNIWLGTWGGGLNKLQVRYGKSDKEPIVERITYLSKTGGKIELSSNIIQALYEDSESNLWIGTEDGLDLILYSGKTLHFRSDPSDSNTISDNRIQSKCIIEDRSGNMWVGTWDGLNYFVLNRENFGSNSDVEIIRIAGDNNKDLSLSDNRIVAIYEDTLNAGDDEILLWIGTIGGGLNELRIKPDNVNSGKDYKINVYTEKEGLANNVIYGILGDDYGNIWLSTNNGISRFNPADKTFRNYDIYDGLQSNQFSWGAYCKTRDGELFFGGTNGLNSFNPEELYDNDYIPPVYITGCSILRAQPQSRESAINVNTLAGEDNIRLPYDTYTLRFEFSALDYTTPAKNQYEYILDGYDKTWIKQIATNSATYTNVQDGKYTFRVRASNNDGLWNYDGASLNVTILTPFWKTWWFIIITISIIAFFIFYFVFTQIKNMLAVERLRTKLAADLHDNIGSSLTEISILSEVIGTRISEEEDYIKKNLNRISQKSRSLIDKMSDIVWLVNPNRDSLYDLILRLQDTYSELLADTNISLKSENLKSLQRVSLQMEHRQHLFLIFKEAINNSINHSGCSEISLNANVSGKKLIMLLKDNGKGFAMNKGFKGNGLDNMKRRAKMIKGELFIESSPDNGTTIKYIGNIK
ncbi:MAG: hypothetical protein JW995_02305 [Melioribacteraceae bacterium]|nr:hypothetical protein [Melioribacteraceae bacterium]